MRKTLALLAAAVFSMLGVYVPQADARDAIPIQTNEWRIYKPQRTFKDLPTFRPKEPADVPDFGLLTLVCRKTDVYMLLVQPALKMGSATQARIGAGETAPIALTFRNLYASKPPIAKLIDWDADIWFSEAPRALLAALASARRMRFDLGDASYLVELDDFGVRLPSFEAYCATGVVRDPRAFGLR